MVRFISYTRRVRSAIMNFLNKVVIVTGASSGIGAATAIHFSKEGAKLTIVGRNEAKLNNVTKKCREVGQQPLVVKADVTEEDACKHIIQHTVNTFGDLHVLVNNAGIARYSGIDEDNHINIFDEILKTNLRAAVYLTHLAVPFLIKTKGNIVNVSSVSGSYVPNIPKSLPYIISKAGLDHFTRGPAYELARHGIRVNAVSPGPVRTDVMENSGITGVAWDAAKPFTLLNQVGEPEEIADIISFLASDRARCVTGSVYVSDNGLRLKR